MQGVQRDLSKYKGPNDQSNGQVVVQIDQSPGCLNVIEAGNV